VTAGQQRRANARAARLAREAANETERAEVARKRAEREAKRNLDSVSIAGGRGSAKPGGATTSIDPHPQVLVNQLVNQYAPSIALEGELEAVVAGRALNPRAVLVKVDGKVVGARKNPAQAFPTGAVVAIKRERNEWVVVGRYNRFGVRVFDSYEQQRRQQWCDGQGDPSVAVCPSGQRVRGVRGAGEGFVGADGGGEAGWGGDGGEGAGEVHGEEAVGGTGACEGYGVGADEGGEVNLYGKENQEKER
jgi:hypothetical protein